MRDSQPTPASEQFHIYLIKPSHYDDQGYVIQWLKTDIPSNTLAVMYGLARAAAEHRILGDQVDITVTAIDEMRTRVRADDLARKLRTGGNRVLIALIGVQSNQFPRAVDIARPFRAAGIPVCIGGFHVSGSIAMLPDTPPEIQAAMDLGITVFCGEAEEHFDALLRDAYLGKLKPLYNVMAELPDLRGAVYPELPPNYIQQSMTPRASFDAGRGCPFQCSFCTIINVQGRKSRYRDADDVEALLRRHYANGVRKFFITDDNFARNKNWEAIFDRIIKMREEEGLPFKFLIQVDTLCHKIHGFIEKAGRAGVDRVFIGLENINPDNLAAANKKQNRISEYRAMLQAWKGIGAITTCGYIIGFPNDTRERVLRDIQIIQRELPMDFLEFFCLTPLPGSQDHQQLLAHGVTVDPDLNNYDTEHVTTAHPLMSADEFIRTYRAAWHAYYTPDHVETILRRGAACGIKPRTLAKLTMYFYGCQAIEGIHPLQGGLFRRKYRHDRRYGWPIENPLRFYGRYAFEIASRSVRLAVMLTGVWRRLRKVTNDPNTAAYTDLALTPVSAEELQQMDIIKATNAVATGHVGKSIPSSIPTADSPIAVNA